MSEWEELTLEQAGITVLDCDHATPEAQETGYPYVGIPQMENGRINFASARKISESDFVHWTRKTNYQPNDVILSRRTNPGVTAIDQTNTKFALGQNLVLLRSNGLRVLPEFLRWMVRGPAWWNEVAKFKNEGAVFSSLKCKEIPKFSLPIPPLPHQAAINRVLSGLDDKIELNRQMNETLEAMARALFQDWFVDFGPTRRKIAGETDPVKILGEALPDPTRAAEIADLFPAQFSDDGLPVGWQLTSFAQMVDIIGGGTPKTNIEEYWNGNIPWFSVVDAPSNGQCFVIKTEKSISEDGLQNSSARLVPEYTTIISARGTVGKVALSSQNMTFNQSCYALSANEHTTPIFVYFSTLALVERLKSMAHGSVFSTITRGTFDGTECNLPTLETCTAFDAITKNNLEKIRSNLLENQTLAELRDLLLPKLMSGEISVAEAEDMI